MLSSNVIKKMKSTIQESDEQKKLENYLKLLRDLHYHTNNNESQDLSKLKEILALRDINYQMPHNGLTVSHLAANIKDEWFKLSFAEFLIDRGADPTIANHKGQTAVHWVVSECDYSPGWLSKTQSISFLLTTIHIKNRNTTNYKDSHGFSHFHAACMINYLEIVEFFMNNGVSVDEAVDMDSSKYPGYTPLHFAIEHRHVDLVNLLLNSGANLIKDSRGMSPLHVLIKKNMDIIQYASLHRILVAEFEEKYYRMYGEEPFAEIMEINEKMMRSIVSKRSETAMARVDLFPFYMMRTLKDGSLKWTRNDVNECIPVDSLCWPGFTALHFAARFDVDTVKWLLDKGADIEAKDADGVTPFDLCVGRYNIEDLHHYIISSHKVWKNILLSDGKTKLLDLVLAMRDPGELTKFLGDIQQSINGISIPRDSPLWSGFSILHLAVTLSTKAMRFRVASYVPLFCDHFTMKEAARLDVAKQTDYTADQLIRRPDELVEVCLDSDVDVMAQDSNGSTPIHLAFRRMDLENMYFLLERCTGNSNPTDEDNLSLLHIACALEKVTLVKLLVASGADVNAAVSSSFQWDPDVRYFHNLDSDRHLHVWAGSTPIHIALTTNFRNGRKVVKLLMKAGANLDAKDAFGLTPLHRLFQQSPNSKIVDDDFLSQFISRDCVVDGLSYLHIAALHKYSKFMEKLLDLKVDVNSVIIARERTNEKNLSLDNYRNATNQRTTKFSYFLNYFEGNTPLHMALEHCNDERDYDVAKILIWRGTDVLMKNYRGICPLREMLEDGRYGGLLKHCISVMSDDEEKRLIDEVGVTKLHMACRLCDDDLVEDCLKNGKGVIDVQIRDDLGIWSGYTPLHLLVASFCHHLREPFEHERQTYRAMRLLLDSGADVIIVNAKGETACLLDVWENHVECRPAHMDILWKKLKNSNVNPVSDEGISHFHLACIRNDVDLVERFLKLGVDPNQTVDYYLSDFRRYTPLHFAVCRKTRFVFPDSPALKTINLLLEFGADVHARNANNETPLHLAGKFRSLGALPYKRMFWAGADPDVKSLFRGEVPYCRLFNVESGEVRRLLSSACLYGCYHLLRESYRSIVYYSRIIRGTCGKFCKRSSERQPKRTTSEESVYSEEYDPDAYFIIDI